MQRQGQTAIAGPVQLPAEHNLLLLLEIAVVVVVQPDLADPHNVAVAEVGLQLRELRLVVFLHIGRMQPDEPENIVRKHLHRLGDHRRRVHIHAGEQHPLHLRIDRPLNHLPQVLRIILTIKMSMRIYIKHRLLSLTTNY